MNNNTSTVIGLGALGTLIAYYGYQYFEDDNEDDNGDDDSKKQDAGFTSIKKNIDSATAVDISNNATDDVSMNKIKLEVTEQIIKTQKEKNNIILDNSADNTDTETNIKPETNKLEHATDAEEGKNTDKWSNYWENQYNNIDKKQEITVE